MKKQRKKIKRTKKTAVSSPSKYSPRAKTKGKKGIRGLYPALDPSKNLKIRQETMEGMDYVKTLSDKDKKWLDRFMDGYNNANVRKSERHPIHRTQKDKSICHSVNNSRNKDAYAKAKSKNFLLYDNVPDFWVHADEHTNHNSHESVAINLADAQIAREKVSVESEAFIKEVKAIQKLMPNVIRELKAASSMVKTALDSINNGELAPENLEVKLKESTDSLIQIQGDEKDLSFDIEALREELLQNAHLLQEEEN